MNHLLIGMVVTTLAASAALAQDAESDTSNDAANQAVIDAYMAAYSAADFDAMEQYIAEDVVFSDPTATDQGETGLYHDSRESIMQALREFDAQYNPIALNFEWDTTFESNGRYVFMGRVNSTFPVEQEGMVFMWSAPQTTVIYLRDGLVVEQYDFVNYEGAHQRLVPAE